MRNLIGSGAALAAVLGLLTGCGGHQADNTAAGTPPPATGSASGLETQYEAVVKAVLPSVVQINTGSGVGSGVVYDTKGDIVTNDHVVAGARKIQVTTATGRKAASAELVGEFPADDLAVVRIKEDSLRPARFGDSSKLSVGRIVLAMGNPLGLSGSVSNGIVSALGRTVSSDREGAFPGATIAGAVQTSAPINPGNSGGALVTLDNEVVGIPTLTAADPQMGGAAPGIGFAIPSNTVKSIADQLIANGRVTDSGRAALGVTVRNVADVNGNVTGVGVVSVTKGGPADRAGIASGDVIVSVGGTPTQTTSALTEKLAGLRPGDKTSVTLLRPDGSRVTVGVTLGQLPG